MTKVVILAVISRDRNGHGPRLVDVPRQPRTYFGSTDHKLYAVNRTDGSLKWSFVTSNHFPAADRPNELRRVELRVRSLRSLASRYRESLRPLSTSPFAFFTFRLVTRSGNTRFASAARGLAHTPPLVLTSNDGLAVHTDPLVKSLRALGNTRITEVHQPTDHPWSDKRIALETAIITWLAKR